MSVSGKIDEIADLIESARSMPMSSSAVVNRAELLALIGQLRDEFAATNTEAASLVSNKDEVLEEAHREAAEIIHAAKERRDTILADHELVREAERRAEQLLEQTRAECDEMAMSTDKYVETKLARFELLLQRTLSSVIRGRKRLADDMGFTGEFDTSEIG